MVEKKKTQVWSSVFSLSSSFSLKWGIMSVPGFWNTHDTHIFLPRWCILCFRCHRDWICLGRLSNGYAPLINIWPGKVGLPLKITLNSDFQTGGLWLTGELEMDHSPLTAVAHLKLKFNLTSFIKLQFNCFRRYRIGPE